MALIRTQNKLHIVIGLGKSGIGAAKLLRSCGKDVLIIENGDKNKLDKKYNELTTKGIKIIFTGAPLSFKDFSPWLGNISSIITTPSIPWDNDVLNQLRSKNIEIKSEVAIAWQHLNQFPWIGITGTNGKTTVTTMLNHVLKSNKINTDLGGNVGKSLAELAYKYKKANTTNIEWLVVELSSYQIESAQIIKPTIGIWTTLTPDHLDRHGSFEAYSNIKRSLLEKSTFRIYNSDDSYLSSQRKNLPRGFWVSSSLTQATKYKPDLWINKEGFLATKNQTLFNSSILDLPGEHNLQNLLMVTAASLKIGLKSSEIAKGISTFQGVPHRLEKLGKFKNLSIFNDSKATNYESSISGIKAVPHKTVLIAGGQKKEGSPKGWLESLRKYCCAIVLFGQSNKELKKIIKNSCFSGEVIVTEKLPQAINSAIEAGVKLKAKSILLSPACASFDQYNNFEERGNHFKQLINLILETKQR